jgi:hypothetical protein
MFLFFVDTYNFIYASILLMPVFLFIAYILVGPYVLVDAYNFVDVYILLTPIFFSALIFWSAPHFFLFSCSESADIYS